MSELRSKEPVESIYHLLESVAQDEMSREIDRCMYKASMVAKTTYDCERVVPSNDEPQRRPAITMASSNNGNHKYLPTCHSFYERQEPSCSYYDPQDIHHQKFLESLIYTEEDVKPSPPQKLEKGT